MTNQAKGFALDLYDYQKRSLTWMMDVESNGKSSKVTRHETKPLARFESLPYLLDLNSFKSVHLVNSGSASKVAYVCKGGILADNPGI